MSCICSYHSTVCLISLGVVCFVGERSVCVGCCDFCLICDARSFKCVCNSIIFNFVMQMLNVSVKSAARHNCIVMCFLYSL